MRAGCKLVLSTLLAAIALVAASTVSTNAQTNWTGQVSTNWFLNPNWDTFLSPRQTDDANINTVAPNSTVIASPGAEARNLDVGVNGTGLLAIQNGGTLIDFGLGFVGNLPGGQGTVTVTGAGSNWQTNGSITVGAQGTGTLTIQDGGTMNSHGGGSVGLAAGSTGTVTVTGPGSTWNNSPGGGLNIGSFGTGTLMIANGGRVINITPAAANIGNGAGSQGMVTVTGAGSIWSNSVGVNIGLSGTGALTVADGGIVNGPIVIATTAGAVGTLNIGASAGSPAAAPGTLTAPSVAFGAGTGTINFNHTSADYVFAPAISGDGAVNVLAGTTILTANNTYTGGTTISAGTLELGAGGTSGSIVGNVADNGALVFNRVDTVTFPGVVSGAGSVTQIGSGNTILTATNTYTGGTTISAGTLELGAGGTSGSIVGNVADNGALVFNRVDTVTFPGVISGTGQVVQLAGTTILTGDSDYTGATRIVTGTLELGAGGTSGSIVGNVADNGALVFNRVDSVTFPGVISGAGQVVQLAGTTILTGDSNYTGVTHIASGTLQLGNGGTTGSIVGNVTDNGTLAFNRSDTVTFPGAISGSGAVSQIGSGTTILTADNIYSGRTTISAGTLQLGNGRATGGIKGDVTDNGTLAFDRSDEVVFPGVISGTGSVSQIGSGSTTLTAANSYSGGTLLDAGTLIAGDNSALGSGALTVPASAMGTTLDNTALATMLANGIVLNPSANLTMAGSNPLTLAGAISGDGALTKNGASTLIPTADNSYAGGTTINSGRLQVGDGGATGSIGTGPVLDDAALVFNRSGIVTVPGAITGMGSLTQMGVAGGTLVLTGGDTYSGGTTIASGVLQLGDGGSTGSIVGMSPIPGRLPSTVRTP